MICQINHRFPLPTSYLCNETLADILDKVYYEVSPCHPEQMYQFAKVNVTNLILMKTLNTCEACIYIYIEGCITHSV